MVTDCDLARARQDAGFRRRLIASHLDHLLTALTRLRAGADRSDPVSVEQMSEGVELAVRLADMLQSAGGRIELEPGPS